MRANSFDQVIGPELAGWKPPAVPPAVGLTGRFVALEPIDRSHVDALFVAFAKAPASLWTYMPFGPFGDRVELGAVFDKMLSFSDWRPFAILVGGVPLGFCAYLRIDARGGVIEIGSIAFSPQLQQTAAATEAIYLLLKQAFDMGYRRVEWKCDDLNVPSGAAAVRLGFQYEGTFRNAAHYKGRSRDTAWFAIIDRDWPGVEARLQQWLLPTNFDPEGIQRTSLGSFGETE